MSYNSFDPPFSLVFACAEDVMVMQDVVLGGDRRPALPIRVPAAAITSRRGLGVSHEEEREPRTIIADSRLEKSGASQIFFFFRPILDSVILLISTNSPWLPLTPMKEQVLSTNQSQQCLFQVNNSLFCHPIKRRQLGSRRRGFYGFKSVGV